MFSEDKKYDCVVIGGGPAGMMAAIRAGELGKKVLLLEKNKTLGKKLLLTGDGRCNISHLEKSNKDFSLKFGKKGDFLLSPFSVFGSKETFEFFIRAEVVNWEKLIECNGFAGAREKGLIRTEGKEYVVKDGDVIEIKSGK
jgi:predicted flavoprotein YhiN